MNRIRARLPVFAAALWWGSLTAIGFLVVPMLFAHLPTPALAGGTAARLFGAQTWVSIGCALLLLMFARPIDTATGRPGQSQGAVAFILLGLLLALIAEFGVSPRIVARENLRLWHGVGSAMYLAQWLCAGVVLWRLQDGSPIDASLVRRQD
ncbi:MAG: DUF4149 domain-containing protein [Comamonadaceae bacterium]|nr:MAG: DUF4149 domain-containing protein [Comamonadaceae bacterium]